MLLVTYFTKTPIKISYFKSKHLNFPVSFIATFISSGHIATPDISQPYKTMDKIISMHISYMKVVSFHIVLHPRFQ
jgi:hypothetical protein